MTNRQLCFDAWVVRQLTNDNFGNEHWDIADSVNYGEAFLLPSGQVKKTKFFKFVKWCYISYPQLRSQIILSQCSVSK